MLEALLESNLEHHTENASAKCAANIALYNFNSRYETLVLFNSTLIFGLDLFLKLYNKSVTVMKDRCLSATWTSPESIKQYVLFGPDVLIIAQMLAWMKTRRFDNTGKYVIVCESNEKACNEDEAVDVLWNHQIVNVVFIRLQNNGDIVGFTYLVYDDDTCTKKLVNIDNLDGCVFDNEKQCENMFPVKFKNFHKCELIVSTFAQVPFMWINKGIAEGADGDLLTILGDTLNASLVIRTPNEGDGWGTLEDGRWLGSLGDVYYDLANFSMTSPAFTISRTEYFQSSIDYNICNVIWVTHPAYLRPSWIKLFRPFTPRTFIIFAIIYFFIVIIAICIKSLLSSAFSGPTNVLFSTNNIIFYSWSICMGLPITNIPKITALMCIVECWVLYCFLIRTFYQASLISALKFDVYYPHFNTIEEVINAKYPFGGVIALRDYYVDDPIVYDDWSGINSTDLIPTLNNLSRGMEFVLAMNRETARYFMKTERKKVHILRQKVIRSPTGLLFKKFSPLVRSINRILRALVESGITQMLFKYYTQSNTMEEPKSDEPFTTAHYSGCYIILAFGWILSLSVLAIEIIVFKCKTTPTI
nr:ionotropic receptor 7d.2 [Achelura yunnanensis]